MFVFCHNNEIYRTQEVLVRINPRNSGLEEDDMKALFASPRLPDGIVLPKCEHPEDIQWLCKKLDELIGIIFVDF